MDEILSYIKSDLTHRAMKLFPGRKHDQNDLVQEVTLRFLTFYDEYKKHPLVYQKMILNRIMSNCFIDIHRANKRNRIFHLDPSNGYDENSPGSFNINYLDECQTHPDDYERYMNFIVSSKDKAIRAFFLYYCGYKTREIVPMIGERTLENVTRLIRVARKKIQDNFELTRNEKGVGKYPFTHVSTNPYLRKLLKQKQ